MAPLWPGGGVASHARSEAMETRPNLATRRPISL